MIAVHLRTLSRYTLISAIVIGILSCVGDAESEEQTETPDTTIATQPVQHGFDELSSEYYESDIRVIWQKPMLVIDLMGDLSDKTVADIGAGTGYFAFRIAGEGGHVIAIDIDPRAIEFMESEKERYPEAVQERFSTRLATPDDARIAPGEVDVILLVNTYIYINNRIQYFRKLKEGLKPGGKVIIVDFKNEQTTIGPDLDERIALTEVQRELTEAGYAIESTDVEMLDYQYVIVATLP